MSREEENDVKAEAGEYPKTIESVLNTEEFRKWLGDRFLTEVVDKLIARRGQLVNFKPLPITTDADVDGAAMFSFDFDDEGRPWAERDPESVSMSDQYDASIHETGPANGQIADVALKLDPKVEVYGQQETVDAYNVLAESKSRLLIPYHRTSIPRYVESSPQGARPVYLGTKTVACDLVWRGLWRKNRIAVIAHSDHVRRCCGAVRRAVIDERLRRNWQWDGDLVPAIVVPDLSQIEYPTLGWQVWVSGAGKAGRGGPDDFRRHEVTARIRALVDGWLTWHDLA